MRKSGKSHGFPHRHHDGWRQDQQRAVRYPRPAVNPRRNLPRRGAR